MQFSIPIYQRNYSWTESQCKQLWDDILRAGSNKQINAHFIGSIVYIERALSTVTIQESLLVIDGQQRLTTCTLIIAALADYFDKNNIGEILDTFSVRKLRNYYLLNPEEEHERHFKLILSETDRDTLLAILKNTPLPEKTSISVEQNYRLFQSLIAENQNKLEQICSGLDKLMIVDVSLDRSQDNPQLIFESMNSTGLELSQADLIRNYVLMGLEPTLQTELYQNYWRKMEEAFGQEAYTHYFDDFMRHYLTAKTSNIPNIRQVYKEFKDFSSNQFKGDIRGLVADVYNYATYYCAIALNKETNDKLRQSFQDLRELKVDVAYPFLLDTYCRYSNKQLSADEMCEIVNLIESYVFRRAVCGIATNSLNKTFATLSRLLDKNKYLESLKAEFLIMPSYRRFPNDEEFIREIQIRNLYNFPRRSYFLRKLENHMRKEKVDTSSYTIEHVMPQNKNLSDEWKEELGENWQTTHETYLHTLGNLTLTGYNSEYSDRPFAYKREEIKNQDGDNIGLAHSPLQLNADFREVAKWDENAIKKRAERLAKRAVKTWHIPQLSKEQLEKYIAEKEKRKQNEPNHLQTTELLEKLDAQILALDECISKESKDGYVVYKAESDIALIDVTGRNTVLIKLNIPFVEIRDSRGLCQSAVQKNKCTEADEKPSDTDNVFIGLKNMEDLPYIIGLIQQAFDWQINNSELV